MSVLIVQKLQLVENIVNRLLGGSTSMNHIILTLKELTGCLMLGPVKVTVLNLVNKVLHHLGPRYFKLCLSYYLLAQA